MSNKIHYINRQEMCATCLSRDRDLNNLLDLREHIMSYAEISLQKTDKICWECHGFVQKMILFKAKARSAQVSLLNIENGVPCDLQCLSSLKATHVTLDSTLPCIVIGVDTSRPETITETAVTNRNEIMIKLEVDRNTFDNSTIKYEATDDINSMRLETTNDTTRYETTNDIMKIKCEDNNDINARTYEAANDVNEMRCETTNDFKRETTNDMSETECEAIDDINNVETANKPVEINVDDPRLVSNGVCASGTSFDGEISVFTHKTVSPDKRSSNSNEIATQVLNIFQRQQTDIPDYILFKEHIMSEQEMLQWRQMKIKSDYYVRGVPTERCEMCIEPFDLKVSMETHRRRHTDRCGELVCEICQQRSPNQSAMDVHKKWHYRLLKCRFCNFEWDNVNTMRQHCSDMHKAKQTVWDCDQCEKKLRALRVLTAHTRTHRVAKCTNCGKVVHEAALHAHMLIHKAKQETCEECGAKVRDKHQLRNHLKRHRIQINPEAYCVECQKQFRTMTTYKMHLKGNKHAPSEEFRFECNECGKKFLKQYFLQIHMQSHGGAVFPCCLCDQSFKTQANRRKHTRLIHEGKPKKINILTCDYCGRSFKTKNVLKDHINSHTGARPHVCKICGDNFGHKSALYLHGRYKHKIQMKTKNTKEKKQ